MSGHRNQPVGPHPRLWLTPPILANLKALAARGDDRWLKLKQAADVAPADWGTGIVDYCLAYQVTGDPVYAIRAWTLMQQSMGAGMEQVTSPDQWFGFPTGTNEVSGDSGYQCRNYFPAACVVLDWLDNWLSPDQKLLLVTDIQVCADWVWTETNPARAHQWGVDADAVGNNYHQAFMFTWLAGLVLPPSAKQQGYLDNALRRFDTEIVPHLATLAAGGVWLEGLGYGTGSTGFLLWNLLAHFSATGEDLIQGNPWFTDAVSAMIQFTMPNLAERAPFGDLAAGPLNDYNRRVMLCMANRDRRCNPWLAAIQPNRNQQLLTRWEELLFSTPPPVPAATGEPTFFQSPGTGLVSSRTGWDSGATQLLAVCGPTMESHQDRAQGAAMLWRNGWQLGTAKLGSHSGLDQECWDYACLTVNGAKQAWTQNGCHWVRQEDTPEYTFLAADLTAAYPGLSGYTRELFFVKATGYLLIRDRYAPANNAIAHFPVMVKPAAVNGGFQAGSLFGMPEGGLALSFDGVQNDPLDTKSYRVNVGGDPTGEIRMVLEAGRPGQASRTFQPTTRGIAHPAGWIGWAWGAGPWSFTEPNAGVQYLLGLKPSASYRVSSGGPVLSSAAGVLSWAGLGGPVTITEGSAPPPPPPPPPSDRKYLLTIPATGPPSITELP